MKLDLFGKPISLIMTIFGKNGGDCREKNGVSMENYNTPLWTLDSSPVHCHWGFVIYLWTGVDPKFF